MFLNLYVQCDAGDTDDQVLDRIEKHLGGQSVVYFCRSKPYYAFIVVPISDNALEEKLLQQHGVSRGNKQPNEFEIRAFQRRLQQRRRPINSQPPLTVVTVHGRGLSTVCNYTILGWFRKHAPLVNITRGETLDTVSVTMLEENAFALLQESKRGIVLWPLDLDLRLELDSDASPADPSVSINGDDKVCSAHLLGHCKHYLLCPLGLSHPLHESGIDYDDVLLRHSRKRKAIESTGDEDCDTAGEFHANTFPIMPLPCKLNLLLCFHFCK